MSGTEEGAALLLLQPQTEIKNVLLHASTPEKKRLHLSASI